MPKFNSQETAGLICDLFMVTGFIFYFLLSLNLMLSPTWAMKWLGGVLFCTLAALFATVVWHMHKQQDTPRHD